MTAPTPPLLCPKCQRGMAYFMPEESNAMVETWKCKSGHLVFVQRQQVWTD